MTATKKTSARCECGALVVEIAGDPVVQLVCHCSDCRAFSGRAYTDAVFFKPEHCSLRGRTNAMTTKGATGFDKTHYSCARCNTPLYVTVAALNGAWAVVANRISPFRFEPNAHIWTSEKADGVTIPATMAQSPGAPPKEIVDTMLASFWGVK